MRRAHSAMGLMLIVAAAGSACTIDEPKPTYDLGTFPYHPLVYELDLAILAYQVHAQSMVWPIDPYYDYARIHPWSHTVTNNQDEWTEYLTPDAITRRIRDIYVSARPIGGDGSTVALMQVPPGRVDSAPDATDVLCAFEGGTGDRGIPGQPASYSLMGFALARDTGGGSYDVHLAFRGSRSGSAWRAITQAFSEDQAAGNPDSIAPASRSTAPPYTNP